MRFVFLFFIFFLFTFSSCAQHSEINAEKFIRTLNEYKVDSLNLLTTDDFYLVEPYANSLYSKKSFLDTFVTNSKALNGRFKILKVLSMDNPLRILVEDVNDYRNCLKTKQLTWIITLEREGNKIKSMRADTTEGFKEYMDDFMIKNDQFLKWLKKTYPNVDEEVLYDVKNGLLSQRLKEYSLNH